MSRTRLNIFLEPEHAMRLDDLAVHRGVSKSSIVASALSNFLGAESGDQREAVMGRRLDRLSHQFDRLERDQNILIETLALYIRYYLTVSLPVPDGPQDAARAQGRLRFNQFIEQLGRHLQRGRSLVRDVQADASAQEAMPNPPASPSEITP